MTGEYLQILRHSLGIDGLRWYDSHKIYNEPYRNYFASTEGGMDYKILIDLVKAGYMEGPFPKFNMHYFVVTESGIEMARISAIKYANSTKPSRSKARYQAYLHSESDETFFEWLSNKYWDDYRKRYKV